MRQFVVLHVILILCVSCRQMDTRIKRTIELKANGDTVKIQEFDKKGNLIFWKHFPTDYGISQVLTYQYENEKLVNYTWVHSNAGFIISEYTYDPTHRQRLTYRYESGENYKMTLNLLNIHSLEQLRSTEQYKQNHDKRNRFLSEISIYKDTLVTQQTNFNQTGDTISITTFEYENGLMIKETRFEHGLSTILTHTYDTAGNELGWIKIYLPADTSVQYRMNYNGKLLTKEISISGNERTTTQFYYNDGLLVREIMTNDLGEIEREITYTYDRGRRVSQKIDNYSHLGKLTEFNYVHETF